MNEGISKDPLYIEIMKNRCLTCYKAENSLVPLTEKSLLKMLVPEITLTPGDHICEDCNYMVTKIIRFRNTVLTAQLLLKTAYEQQSQDVEQKISIAEILKEEKGNVSTLPSVEYSFNPIIHEELHIKEESIAIEPDSEDSEDTLLADPISDVDHDSEETLPAHHVSEDSEGTQLAFPMRTMYNENSMVKGKIMEVNIITSNKTNVSFKNIPQFKKDEAVPRTERIININDKTNLHNDGHIYSDGQIVLYDNAHACTVKMMSETELQAYREAKKKERQYLGMKLKCDWCIKSYKLQRLYEEHMRIHELSMGAYVCSVCQMRFPNNEDMETHRKSHYFKYMCSKCKYEVATLEMAVQHYVRQHYVLKRECKRCDAVFDTFRELQRHNRMVHREKVKCNQCGAMVRNKSNLKLHMARHNGEIPDIECNICSKKIKATSLKSHMENVHSDNSDGMAYCKPCDQMFKNEKMYQVHLKRSQKHNRVESFKYKCEECGKYLGSGLSLKSHMETIHNDTPKYQCEDCDEAFKTSKMLKRHILRKHTAFVRTRNVICDLCGKAFYTKKTLEEHMTVHTGARPHACADCGATFGFKGALFTHRRLKHKVKRKKDT